MCKAHFCLLFIMLLLPAFGIAETEGAPAPGNDALLQSVADHRPSASGAETTTSNVPTPEQQFRLLQEQDKHMELFALIASMVLALSLILVAVRFCGRKAHASVVNGGGLVLIIFGTLFIAVYASTPDQLTAPIGILGAIAGYLFGSAQHTQHLPAKPKDESDVIPQESQMKGASSVVVPLQAGPTV